MPAQLSTVCNAIPSEFQTPQFDAGIYLPPRRMPIVGQLTDAEAAELRNRLKEGDYATQKELAQEFEIAESTVTRHKRDMEAPVGVAQYTDTGQQTNTTKPRNNGPNLMEINWNDADDTEAEETDKYECGNCGASLEYLEEKCSGCGDAKAWGGITDDDE